MSANLPLSSHALLERAYAILERTNLIGLFAERFGTASLTGSVRYDLMVWPDIDIHMPVEAARRLDWAKLIVPMNAQLEGAGLRLHKAQFLDDYVDPHPLGAGLYWGLEFVDETGMRWKADIWGWEPDDYRKRLVRDQHLADRLSQADRALILRLKTEALARKGYYGVVVSSMDIYRFVLAKGGDSLETLELWLGTAQS